MLCQLPVSPSISGTIVGRLVCVRRLALPRGDSTNVAYVFDMCIGSPAPLGYRHFVICSLKQLRILDNVEVDEKVRVLYCAPNIRHYFSYAIRANVSFCP